MVQRDMTARQRIRAYLHEDGPVVDDAGGATARLREAVDYQGSPLAFIQLIAAMERAGEITREIKGKRTYGIAPGADRGADAGVRRLAPPLDYDRLAIAVLREAARAITADGHKEETQDPGTDTDTRIAALERQVAAAIAARDTAVQERDALAARLETTTRNLGLLSARLNRVPAARATDAEQALTPGERDLLRRMLADTTIAS